MKPTDQSQPYQRPNKKKPFGSCSVNEVNSKLLSMTLVSHEENHDHHNHHSHHIFIRATIDKGNSLWFYVLQYNESEIKFDIYYCVMSNGHKH